MGWIKEAAFGSENFTDSILRPLPSSLTCVQFCWSVVQILGSVLLSDNGSAAHYIQTHQLVCHNPSFLTSAIVVVSFELFLRGVRV